jgi:uncharacterized repeat protein (TIGR03837 family)
VDNQAMPISTSPSRPAAPLRWDIFCQVIDNFGDIGVCWRLSAQLAARGQRVRLWVDDASALAWMAPKGCPGVEVRAWTRAAPQVGTDVPGDVVIEAFGCDIDAAWVASGGASEASVNPNLIANYPISTSENSQKTHLKPVSPPVWINLEYLSAEPYAQRSHGLASPVMHGPAAGMTKRFFYPGFTHGTGGLLGAGDGTLPATEFAKETTNEPSAKPITEHIAQPARSASNSPCPAAPAASRLTVSLFCYEPPALSQLLELLGQPRSAQATELLVTSGRASAAVQSVLGEKNGSFPTWIFNSSLSISECLSVTPLPLMPHAEYDALLARCQLNFVRGEDSLVRALWAGQAFVWQIYPQSDGAHAAKLDAFLDWLQAPADLRLFHHVWNGLSSQALPAINLLAWTPIAQAARGRLNQQADLVTQLIDWVA